MTDKSRFENRVDVTGIVNNKEFNGDVGNGLGRVVVNADGNTVSVQMWEKSDDNGNSLGIVENFIANGIYEGETINANGELGERLYDGEYRRQVTNRFISKDEVNGIDKLSDEDVKEFARVKLSGDVLENELDLTDIVRGEEVDKETQKLNLTIVIFNTWNPNGSDDLTRKEVLINEIKRHGKYLEKNDKDASKFEEMVKRLEDNEDSSTLYQVLEEFLKEEPRTFGIEVIHSCAYHELAEKIHEDVKKGDNITIGCDILNTQVTDEYGIPQGSLNEIEIKSYGGVNEESDLSEGGDVDANNVW